MSDESIKATSGVAGVIAPSCSEPYRPPVLVKLGTVRDLTMSVNNTGRLDGRSSRRTGRGGRFDAAGCAS